MSECTCVRVFVFESNITKQEQLIPTFSIILAITSHYQ